MSFVFEWDKLDDDVALQIEGMIHAHFQRIPKPAFMGNIAVSKFRFGSTPPAITVLDVTDPLEEWYFHMDQEEARLAQEALEAGGGESMDEDELASGEGDEDDDDAGGGGEYGGEFSFSTDGSIVIVGEGDDDIEYLQSGPFEEDERRETEEWLSNRLRTTTTKRGGRRSGASSVASHPRREAATEGGESGSDQEEHPPLQRQQQQQQQQQQQLSDRHNQFKSAVASPTRVSRSSSIASSSSTDSRIPHYRGESAFDRSRAGAAGGGRGGAGRRDGGHPTMDGRRNDKSLKLDTTSTLLSASSRVFTTSPTSQTSSTTIGKMSAGGNERGTHSLSSHASDEEIESEAFYTQGESTIYHRMKNMLLEPSSILSPKTRSLDGDDHTAPVGATTTTSSSSASSIGSGHANGNGGGLGFGFGAGIGSGLGSSPGAVLSSVMQTRANRPLSAASFYSSSTSPSVATAGSTSTTITSTTTCVTGTGSHAAAAHGPQLYFPDLSGMMIHSGNTLIGLGMKPLGSSVYSSKAGTPSQTIPSTPRGFESPTLAFSRRQSFSESGGNNGHGHGHGDGGGEEFLQGLSVAGPRSDELQLLPGSQLTEMMSTPRQHNPSAFTSPIEAQGLGAIRSMTVDASLSTRDEAKATKHRSIVVDMHTKNLLIVNGGERGGLDHNREGLGGQGHGHGRVQGKNNGDGNEEEEGMQIMQERGKRLTEKQRRRKSDKEQQQHSSQQTQRSVLPPHSSDDSNHHQRHQHHHREHHSHNHHHHNEDDDDDDNHHRHRRHHHHHHHHHHDHPRRRSRRDTASHVVSSQLSLPATTIPEPSKRHENDIQLLLSVQYQGQMGFTVETELLLNYPTFAFLALPVKLVITGFSFKAKVLMGYLRDHVNVCFLEPEDPSESILSNVRIESQVGDEQKQAVLKNVGKIERFVLEQMRKFITEDFVYPSYHSVKLERAAPPPPPPPPPLSSSSSPPPQQSSSTSSLTANSTYTRTDNHGTRTAMTSNSPNMANSIATAPPSVTSRSSSSTGTSMITGAVGGGGGGVGGGEGYSTSVRPRPNTPSSVTYQRHY